MLIFTDFDGTLAQNDVGDLFFRTFSDWKACLLAIQRWEQDEISSREVLELAASTTRVTQKQFDEFCGAQQLSPGFLEFVEFCRKQKWSVIVLSDGLDYYIKTILQRHGLDLPVFSNQLDFAPPDRIRVSFPYWEESCGRCANCKHQHVRRLAKPGQRIVYIGDGFSDRCGAQKADIVFAKNDLAKWCKREGRNFRRFENFTDVLASARVMDY